MVSDTETLYIHFTRSVYAIKVTALKELLPHILSTYLYFPQKEIKHYIFKIFKKEKRDFIEWVKDTLTFEIIKSKTQKIEGKTITCDYDDEFSISEISIQDSNSMEEEENYVLKRRI